MMETCMRRPSAVTGRVEMRPTAVSAHTAHMVVQSTSGDTCGNTVHGGCWYLQVQPKAFGTCGDTAHGGRHLRVVQRRGLRCVVYSGRELHSHAAAMAMRSHHTGAPHQPHVAACCRWRCVGHKGSGEAAGRTAATACNTSWSGSNGLRTA